MNLALDAYEQAMLDGSSRSSRSACHADPRAHGAAVRSIVSSASYSCPHRRGHSYWCRRAGFCRAAGGSRWAGRRAHDPQCHVDGPRALAGLEPGRGLCREAHRLGQAYVRMGARPTFTCAPYQTENAPCFGEQIAWSESNAVAFANSVIGARTNRYGDYLDICCALTGRAPAAGLHLDEPRLATTVVELESIPPELPLRDDFYPVLGYLLGSIVSDEVPVVAGLECQPTEDQLKAMAAAAASSGEVAMFHIAGITPEALTLAEALGNRQPRRTVVVSMADLRRTREALTTASGSRRRRRRFRQPSLQPGRVSGAGQAHVGLSSLGVR